MTQLLILINLGCDSVVVVVVCCCCPVAAAVVVLGGFLADRLLTYAETRSDNFREDVDFAYRRPKL